MYITITAQKTGSSYAQSVGDFVAYLEKENVGKEISEQEHFFNQYGEEITPKQVIREIDGNTDKLKKSEPKFYSITVNPSQHELQQLNRHSEDLKHYTRELMKSYAASFNREIDGKKVGVDQILYFAKIEHERTYKGSDIAIRENAPFRAKIARLNREIQQIKSGKLQGSVKGKLQRISKLEQQAPHQLHGKMITQGMSKAGSQTHIHIIVSRKDKTNKYSLSPGSKYKASEVEMNGKTVKRGFNRDAFFKNAEKVFDKSFSYKRNYVETYSARKTFVKHPEKYMARLMGLQAGEKALAFKLLNKADMKLPLLNVPVTKPQLAYKLFKKLKKGFDKSIQSGSINI